MAVRFSALAAVLLAAAGCKSGDEGPPGCRMAPVPLVKHPLAQARDARLLRAGGNFVLGAHEAGQVRWARLDASGALTGEGTLALPAMAGEPALAAIGRTEGDRLVAAYLGRTAEGRPAFVSTSQVAGEAPVTTTLWEVTAQRDGTPRIAAGGGRTTRRAVVAAGIEGGEGSPTVAIVGPDGALVGQPAPLYRSGQAAAWRCLDVVAGRTDLVVSVLDVSRRGRPQWHAFELRDDGSRGPELTVELDVKSADCPAVAPSPLGYVLAYRNEDGVFFSEFDVDKGVVIGSLVAGALRFGARHEQPRVAGVSAVGAEFAVLLDRPTGHEVLRFDAFGTLRGGRLPLTTARGEVGPASAQPAPDAMHVTHLDIAAGNSAENQRYLTKVDCPSARSYPDGGTTSDGAGK